MICLVIRSKGKHSTDLSYLDDMQGGTVWCGESPRIALRHNEMNKHEPQTGREFERNFASEATLERDLAAKEAESQRETRLRMDLEEHLGCQESRCIQQLLQAPLLDPLGSCGILWVF